VRALKIEDLLVWQRARELERAVHALVQSTKLCKDRVLCEQMDAASLSVLSNIAAGFEQTSDRAFARYLGMSRGSAGELRAQVEVCIDRHSPPADLTRPALRLCSEMIRMLTSLIRYLRKSSWSDRRA
jgi:four helix bundle protein